ncbi:MAG TPA: M12 family metallo-peptidase, partial [Pyrinomonadaceae bacterium]
MTRRKLSSTVFLFFSVVCGAALLLVSPSVPETGATDRRRIERFVRRHELIRIDSSEAARGVRERGRLSFATPAAEFEIELVPHDLRAASYRAEETVEGGSVRRVEVNGSRTYRGIVRGMEGAEARFTVDDDTVEGMIITPTERYFVEPLRNYTATASAEDFVFYRGSDVLDVGGAACGATLDEKVANVAAQFAAPGEAATATEKREIEIATETDFEYVNHFGDSGAADAEILGIMNQVDGVYQKELGLTFKVVYQHTWATANDPYSSTASDGVLNEFTNYWNANVSVPRDLAHMWTDKLMDNGKTAGRSFTGAACRDSSRAYGVSMRLTNGQKYTLTAHEIGHNLGASHTDQTSAASVCSGSVMNATVGLTLSFCQFSRDQINGHLAASPSCLSPAEVSPLVQFDAPNYVVSEGAGGVNVNVTRTGDTSSGATVDYATGNGTASDLRDYAQASGTLKFAPGETSKSFRVLVSDDLYVEGSETSTLTLSNPAGAKLGIQSVASVTITDNDPAPPLTNPVDDAQFFVRQHYLDFLSREADAGGLDYWANQITKCGADSACRVSQSVAVSAAFFVEMEFQETGYFVYRFYRAAYGRRPAFDEFGADRSRVAAGTDLETGKQSFAAQFVARTPFNTQYPATLTPEQYVDALNANAGNV